MLHRIPRDFCVLPLTDNLFCNFFLKSAIPVFCVFYSFSLFRNSFMEGYLLYPVMHIDSHYTTDILFDSRKGEVRTSKRSQQPSFDKKEKELINRFILFTLSKGCCFVFWKCACRRYTEKYVFEIDCVCENFLVCEIVPIIVKNMLTWKMQMRYAIRRHLISFTAIWFPIFNKRTDSIKSKRMPVNTIGSNHNRNAQEKEKTLCWSAVPF